MKHVVDLRALGTAVLERLAKEKSIPSELEPSLAAFKAAHGVLEAASVSAGEARRASQDALARISAARAELDAEVEALASKLVGCGRGSRANPFAGLSRFTPARLTRLAYRNEIGAVRELAAKLSAGEEPEEIGRKIGECLQRAADLELALTALSGPKSDFDQKRAAREEAAAAWNKAFARLKVRASAAYEDAPGALAAIFAPPERVQRPISRRGRKAEQPPASAEPAAPEPQDVADARPLSG